MNLTNIESENPIWVEKIDKDDDLFTLNEWKQTRECNAIAPYDGVGYWATSSHYSCDCDCFGPKPEWATHVVWFNK